VGGTQVQIVNLGFFMRPNLGSKNSLELMLRFID